MEKKNVHIFFGARGESGISSRKTWPEDHRFAKELLNASANLVIWHP